MYAILFIADQTTGPKSLLFLLRSKGYICICSDSEEEAATLVKSSAVDLVVVDQDLAGVDASRLVERLKALRDVPVISLAQRHRVDWSREASDLLCPKPVDSTMLLSLIEWMCSRAQRKAKFHVA